MPTTLAVEHQRRLSVLADNAADEAEGLFFAVGLYGADVDRVFYENWLPVWEGYVAASFTDAVANIQTHELLATGTVTEGIVAPDDWSTLRGVPSEQVWRRPFLQGWATQSVDQAVDRLRQIATTDVQLASRMGEHAAMNRSKVITGYRRVLGPPPNCLLCIAASTQKYGKRTLKPIHSRCKCGVQPIFGKGQVDKTSYTEAKKLLPPGTKLDGRTLKRFRVDGPLPETTIGIADELGPVLYDGRHAITTLSRP